MSASLVGSEMCIRDRSVSILPAPRQRACTSGLSSREAGRVFERHAREGCLLYTSDAADDM
eukprot:13134678-Alexandrium_andersonii.AAC.1